MSRKKPNLTPLTVSQNGCGSSFSLSDTGSFSKENFVLGANGITQSPLSAGEVSTLRLEQLEPGALIGRGASSRVYRAVHRPSGKSLALKVLQSDIEQNRESRHMVLNEIKVVFGAGSDHLVTFYDAFFHNGAIHLALEYMDCGSLEGLYRVAGEGDAGRLPEGILAAIAFQSVQGLIYLHREKRAVHRDLKPANILLDSAGFVKLSDFGITKELGSGTHAQAGTHVGTLAYMSPERVRGEAYDFASDVWSWGLIALEGQLGYYPYPGAKSVFDVGQMIAHGPLPTERADVQAAVPADLLDLCHGCLAREPLHRPNVTALMHHAFFQRHLSAPVDLGAYLRALQPRLLQDAEGAGPPPAPAPPLPSDAVAYQENYAHGDGAETRGMDVQMMEELPDQPSSAEYA